MATIKNTADLQAQAAANQPDNTTQLISPQDVREMSENLAVSNYNKLTDAALVGLKEFNVLPTYEVGQGTISGGQVYISNKITGPGTFVAADWDLYDALSAADKAKLDFITVTSGADLDQMQTDIAALDGARINKGTFDQSLGVFPGGGTAQDGWTWIAVGVSTVIDGVEINPDDAIVSILDNASTTVFAGNWHLQDNTDKVLTVNGQSGTVVITKTDVGLSNVPNTDFTTAVSLNTAKETNATHSGDAIGDTALTLQAAAITGKGVAGALTGTETVLLEQSGGLVQSTAQDIADLASGDNLGNADLTLTGARVVTMGANPLSFEGNQTTFKGIGSTNGTNGLLVRNGLNQICLTVDDDKNVTAGSGTFDELRSTGYVVGRGSSVVHLTSRVHTFRSDTNGVSKGCAVFMDLADTVILSVGTDSIGVNTNAGGSGISLKVGMRNAVGSSFSFLDQAANSMFIHTNIYGGDRFGFKAVPSAITQPTDGLVNFGGAQTYGASINIRTAIAEPTGTNKSTGSIWHFDNKLKFQAGADTIQLYAQDNTVAASALVGGGGTAITDTDTFGGFTLQQLAQLLLNNGLAK